MTLRPLLALLIPLCAYAGEAPIAYTCDDGKGSSQHITIDFSADDTGRPQASLHFSDENIALPQVPAASGALYRSGDIRLHIRGAEAIFEDGKSHLRHCTQGLSAPPPPRTASQPASSSFIELTGQVSYRARMALPPDASLRIRIQAGPRRLVEQHYELNGAQVPIPFSATVDRDLIGRKASVTVSARIEAGGKILLVSQKPYPAMHEGQPVPVDIRLQPASRKSP